MKVVSMFSGCGGLDLGFIQADFDVVWANDISRNACLTYESNIGDIVFGDVAKVNIPKVKGVDVLAAGFPCQPFSNAGNRRGILDDKGSLYSHCLHFIDELRPRAVIFENVRGILSIRTGGGFLLEEICQQLAARGYEVHFKLVNASDLGVPQNRLRVIIVALAKRKGIGEFRFPTRVEDLDLTLGSLLDIPKGTPNQDELLRLNPQAVALGSLVPEGGSWKDIAYDDLPPRLQRIRDDIARYRWPNFYRRFRRDEIAGTITAAFKPENAGVWHPTEDRVFSVREIARIQSFPDEFLFVADSIKAKYEMIGNAVPPVLGSAFARELGKVLDGRDSADAPARAFSEIQFGRIPIRPSDPEVIYDSGTRQGTLALAG